MLFQFIVHTSIYIYFFYFHVSILLHKINILFLFWYNSVTIKNISVKFASNLLYLYTHLYKIIILVSLEYKSASIQTLLFQICFQFTICIFNMRVHFLLLLRFQDELYKIIVLVLFEYKNAPIKNTFLKFTLRVHNTCVHFFYSYISRIDCTKSLSSFYSSTKILPLKFP